MPQPRLRPGDGGDPQKDIGLLLSAAKPLMSEERELGRSLELNKRAGLNGSPPSRSMRKPGSSICRDTVTSSLNWFRS